MEPFSEYSSSGVDTDIIQTGVFAMELQTAVVTGKGPEIQVVKLVNVLSFSCICLKCSRRFAVKSSLQLHMRTHSQSGNIVHNLADVSSKKSIENFVQESNRSCFVEDYHDHDDDGIDNENYHVDNVDHDDSGAESRNGNNDFGAGIACKSVHDSYAGNGNVYTDIKNYGDYVHIDPDDQDESEDCGEGQIAGNDINCDFGADDENSAAKSGVNAENGFAIDNNTSYIRLTAKDKVHVGLTRNSKACACSVCGVEYSCKAKLHMHFRIHQDARTAKDDDKFTETDHSHRKSVFPEKDHAPRRYKMLLRSGGRAVSGQSRLESSARGQNVGTKTKLRSLSSGVDSSFSPPHERLPKPRTQLSRRGTGSLPSTNKRLSKVILTNKQSGMSVTEMQNRCSVCGEQFATVSKLKFHSTIHTGEKICMCPVCCKQFVGSAELEAHSIVHVSRTYSRDKVKHVCSECGKVFPRAANLRRHSAVHTRTIKALRDVPVLCSLCGKLFKRRRLHRHIRSAHEMNWKTCEICGKVLKGHSSLKTHLRMHILEKPFKCSLCEEQFNHKVSHDDHMRKHTGETPFLCSCCGQAFRMRSSLLRHLDKEHPKVENISLRNINMKEEIGTKNEAELTNETEKSVLNLEFVSGVGVTVSSLMETLPNNIWEDV